ncbi:radical SAM protein, partial [Pseudonocardia bannensis]|nr:radical SAM protein [Pseudonocardia bannensis]
MTDLLDTAAPSPADGPAGAGSESIASLIMDLQAVGLRIETDLATTRTGGAGPSDSGMLWIEGVPVTVPP